MIGDYFFSFFANLSLQGVAEHPDGECRCAVDDLSAIGAALAACGDGAVRSGDGDPDRADGFSSEPPEGPAMPVVATA